MQVRRFYVPTVPDEGAQVVLPPDEALHAGRVLRLREGDAVVLLDGAGVCADASVVDGGRGRRYEGMACRIDTRAVLAEVAVRIRLYVAPPRGGGMGHVIRCATELGVRRISPILCRYGVSRPDVRSVPGWQQDAWASLKQSGNAFLPTIDPALPFAQALDEAPDAGLFGAVPRGDGGDPREVPVGTVIGLWIGPEGGWSEEEEQALAARGYAAVSIGRWILRVETAVPALLGWLVGVSAHD